MAACDTGEPMQSELRTVTNHGADGPGVLSLGARVALFVVALCAMALVACQQDASPDPFIGPSELGLSLTLTASPDVLPLDGASQALLTVFARDAAGQPVANVTVRLQIRVGDVFEDYGRLSRRTMQTGQDGKASAFYSAPLGGSVDTEQRVAILATPVGDNYASAVSRSLLIRLVPNGVVIPPFLAAVRGTPFFVLPEEPTELSPALFNVALCSTDPADSDCISDPDSQLVSFVWDFGDGDSGVGPSVEHTYSFGGSYVVTLAATDAHGRSVFGLGDVTVNAIDLPEVDFSVSPSQPRVGEPVFFRALVSGSVPIVSHQWDFGDGSTASGSSVSHTFSGEGTYLVNLTVTDQLSRTVGLSKSVAVTSSLPSASFVVSPTTPAVNTPVFFDASASRATVAGRTIVSYDWIFGDGSAGTGRTTSHSYVFASTFTVTLTVTDSAGEQNTATSEVVVGGTGGAPTASFTVSPNPTTVTLNTTVDASESRPSPGATIVRYDWDFGETGARFQCPGDSACGDQNRTFVYRYSRAGDYTINLTVTDSTGQTATATEDITVNTVLVTASFTATNTSATGDFVVNFNASASTGSVLTYSWDFGDGTAPQIALPVPTVTHTFADGSTRNVTLTVTDVNGASASITLSVTPD